MNRLSARTPIAPDRTGDGAAQPAQWDIPAVDSYEVNRAIYGNSRSAVSRSTRQVIDLLDLADLITKRCQFVAG